MESLSLQIWSAHSQNQVLTEAECMTSAPPVKRPSNSQIRDMDMVQGGKPDAQEQVLIAIETCDKEMALTALGSANMDELHTIVIDGVPVSKIIAGGIATLPQLVCRTRALNSTWTVCLSCGCFSGGPTYSESATGAFLPPHTAATSLQTMPRGC